LTNTVQTTNIMSFSLLKRKRLLLSQRRPKHQKMVCGTKFLYCFFMFKSYVQVLMLYAFINVVNSSPASFRAAVGPHRSSFEQMSNYQTPASALYGAYEDSSSQGSSSSYGNLYMHGFLIQLLSLCSWIVFSWLLFPPITIISPTRFL